MFFLLGIASLCTIAVISVERYIVVSDPMGAVLFQTRYTKTLVGSGYKTWLYHQYVTYHKYGPQTCSCWSGALLGLVICVEHSASVWLGQLRVGGHQDLLRTQLVQPRSWEHVLHHYILSLLLCFAFLHHHGVLLAAPVVPPSGWCCKMHSVVKRWPLLVPALHWGLSACFFFFFWCPRWPSWRYLRVAAQIALRCRWHVWWWRWCWPSSWPGCHMLPWPSQSSSTPVYISTLSSLPFLFTWLKAATFITPSSTF